tara:strand:- start:1385 stop:1576 length:192 start_codon:yes stop_codon:yes gene_type:complete
MKLNYVNYYSLISEKTNTNYRDWEELDGIGSGVGDERWFRNIKTGQEVYIVNDQNDVTISLLD